MRGVPAAAITELLELEAAGGRLFVLRRRVIALFALATLQCDNFTHLLILPDFGEFQAHNFSGFCRQVDPQDVFPAKQEIMQGLIAKNPDSGSEVLGLGDIDQQKIGVWKANGSKVQHPLTFLG